MRKYSLIWHVHHRPDNQWGDEAVQAPHLPGLLLLSSLPALYTGRDSGGPLPIHYHPTVQAMTVSVAGETVGTVRERATWWNPVYHVFDSVGNQVVCAIIILNWVRSGWFIAGFENPRSFLPLLSLWWCDFPCAWYGWGGGGPYFQEVDGLLQGDLDRCRQLCHWLQWGSPIRHKGPNFCSHFPHRHDVLWNEQLMVTAIKFYPFLYSYLPSVNWINHVHKMPMQNTGKMKNTQTQHNLF